MNHYGSHEIARVQIADQAEQLGALRAERDQLAAQLAAAQMPAPTPLPWWRAWLTWWRGVVP